MDESQILEDVYVADAMEIFKKVFDLSYKEKLRSEDKSHMRELISQLMDIVQKQSREISTLIGAKDELLKLLQKPATYAEAMKSNLEKIEQKTQITQKKTKKSQAIIIRPKDENKTSLYTKQQL
ncbi:hypothetical protein CDAR_122021, partial [Caerostris darwini]